ncbi:hypothetical protein BDV34DRAFT_14574 [Aspergillus parasiticus]|uniref:Uncharacterized protein n=1 Tax=Aspergillus parasiticus TaxID=5067 RepID=A0A5N6D5E8_ASPPA|nr:hypothetical protein BDV34DRAFT_14574 [Aspergillus parasiticus]
MSLSSSTDLGCSWEFTNGDHVITGGRPPDKDRPSISLVSLRVCLRMYLCMYVPSSYYISRTSRGEMRIMHWSHRHRHHI